MVSCCSISNGNILKGFVDGLQVHESSFTKYRHSNLPLELGRRTKSPLSNIQDYFKGYLQDVRISKKQFTQDASIHPVIFFQLNLSDQINHHVKKLL